MEVRTTKFNHRPQEAVESLMCHVWIIDAFSMILEQAPVPIGRSDVLVRRVVWFQT